MNNLKNLGIVLDKKALKSINGSRKTCSGDLCLSGYSNGIPNCVPCGEEEPPKK
ncbi:hypothetical protein ACOSP6_06485 [Tenacibaculum sp. MEBiC06402]|uniref:hypothetical protein n=1 Tax=unclassified Tenacibaculum TaxID=2635139 RepID=UPI003B9D8818